MKWNSNIGARWSAIHRKMIEEGSSAVFPEFCAYVELPDRTDAELIHHKHSRTLALSVVRIVSENIEGSSVVESEAICEFNNVRL